MMYHSENHIHLVNGLETDLSDAVYRQVT